MDSQEVFQATIENEVGLCRRCFKQSETTGVMDSVQSEAASCGDDCGTISASLEGEPINRNKIKERAPRLLHQIQNNGYDIDEVSFNQSIDTLAGVSVPPRQIFIDAIRVGRDEISKTQLLEEYGLEDEMTQRTQALLRKLPASDISEEDLEAIDDSVASKIVTVAESGLPGSSIYYISDSGGIPGDYQPVYAGNQSSDIVMQTVIEQNESWFWNTSPENVDDWLSNLDKELEDCVADCLFRHIRSRQGRTRSDSPSIEEQFRSTSLWPLLKEDGEVIMGFLRRKDEPQSLSEITEQTNRSRSTIKVILEVLNSAEPVTTDFSTEHWQALSSS